jgi:hypothetical protein
LTAAVFFMYFIFSERYVFEEHGIYGINITGDRCSGVHIIQNADSTYIRMYKIKGTWYVRCNHRVFRCTFWKNI